MVVKQQCFLMVIYTTWALVLGGVIAFAFAGQYGAAAAVAVGVPLVQWFSIRHIRSLAPWMGYGRIVDDPAPAVAPAAVRVRLYTAVGCPFCPLIEQRLQALRAGMGFELEKIDVTLRPSLLAGQGIRSVPAVEVGGKWLTGLVSSSELAGEISAAEVHAL